MKESLTDFMVHSIGLVNSSHYDYSDETYTITTWIEEIDGITDNWYLVFPNLTTDFKNATVIKLFHGCTVCWDASVLRHASSKISYNHSDDFIAYKTDDTTGAVIDASSGTTNRIESDIEHTVGRVAEGRREGVSTVGTSSNVATAGEDRRLRGRRRRRNGRSAGNCQLRRKS